MTSTETTVLHKQAMRRFGETLLQCGWKAMSAKRCFRASVNDINGKVDEQPGGDLPCWANCPVPTVVYEFRLPVYKLLAYIACLVPSIQNLRQIYFVEPLTFDRSQSASASSDFTALYKLFYLLTYLTYLLNGDLRVLGLPTNGKA